MALTTNFNFNPYYDDFDENKKFLRILFKPGYAVQARELTQLQTILQKQIERFGNHVFTNGSLILGAKTHVQNCTFLKLDEEYGGVAIDITKFTNKIIYNSTQTKRADVTVAAAAVAGLGEPPTLLINQIYGDPFTEGETIITDDTDPFYAKISVTGASIGKGQAFSVEEGVIYYNGYFIKTDAQSVAISKYDTTSATLKTGFEIHEYFVNASNDSSLIDPSQEATNYQAPGADRYKVEMLLSTRDLDATDDLQNFIELAQFKSGVIQNMKKPTVYNKVADELARRTYDESGNYIVNPFTIVATANTSDNSKIDLVVGSGKAYVMGYEIEKSYPQTLTISKARDTANALNRVIGANYGNFFYTTNHANTFNVNTFESVDLHCVPGSLINTTSAAAITNTKIGTANVKSYEFVTTPSETSGSSYIYATELFNINVGGLVGNIVSSTTDGTKVRLASTFSNLNDAYTGAFLRILSGPGSTEAAKLILDYDGPNQTATVAPPFATLPTTSSVYSLQFNIQDVEGIAITSGTSVTARADISTLLGIDPTTLNSTNKAILYDNKVEELVFRVGENFVKPGTLSNKINYQYQRKFTGTLVSGSTTVSSGGDLFVSTGGTDIGERTNYILTCLSPGGSAYTSGQIIPSGSYRIDNSGTATITVVVDSGLGMTFELIATLSSNDIKTKAYITGNTNSIPSIGKVDVIANRVQSYSSNGQVHIMANSLVTVAETDQSLYVVDVVNLTKVYDFEGTTISNANLTTAKDVTDRYTLITGQKDSYYDHSSIRLKAGKAAPKGPIVVCFNRYKHSGTTGCFTVDSYPTENYSAIPTFRSSSGSYYELRDCLDFRPSLNDEDVSRSFTFSATGPKVPRRTSSMTLNFDYYLPRVDKLHLSADGIYDISTGTSSLDLRIPSEKNGAVTLYEIRLPAYTNIAKDVQFKAYDNRRYTMSDIGKIDRRLKSVEYYTALSLLESDALSKSDTSLYGRSKNGIITDSFVGFNVVDPTTGDFNAGIDRTNKELKTSTKIFSDLNLFVAADDPRRAPTGLADPARQGSLMFLTPQKVVFVEQKSATNAVSVNPYNVQLFIGNLLISPKSDVWIDTKVLPDLIIQNAENQNMMDFINEVSSWAEVEWGSWERVSLTESRGTPFRQRVNGGSWFRDDTVTPVTVFDNQQRVGTLTYFVPETVETSLGENVIDTSVIPFMRNVNITYRLEAMKPLTTLYPFFDEDSISKYVTSHNYFTFADDDLKYFANSANPEIVDIKSGSTVIGNAYAILTSGEDLYVSDVDIGGNTVTSWTNGTIFVHGRSSNTNLAVSGYTYTSGRINTSVAAATTTTFRLSADNRFATFSYDLNNTPVRIVSGVGAGEESVITGFAPTTRAVTVSPAFSVAPTSNSIVQIGEVKTDLYGSVSGTFYVPSGVYRNGEKNFKLLDNSTGKIAEDSSRAIAPFYAQGLLQTKQERILSTVSPRRVVDHPVEERTLTSRREDRIFGPTQAVPRRDPVAETFLVDGGEHPDGIFLSSVRVCFKNKDRILPITCEIRPVVNGYPSANEIYPFGSVTLTQDKVKITDYPDLDDATKYTEFVLESPVLLMPGEHCVVFLSNSNLYEIWIATKDRLDVNTNNPVSGQPFLGSFFKSQNGQTWTAEQESDMMFRLYKLEYDTTEVKNIDFNLKWRDSTYVPTTNANVDVMVLTTQDINFANTTLRHSFNSKTKNGTSTGYVSIIPNITTLMLDTFGSRVIEPKLYPDVNVRVTMSTRNKDISPVIDIDRYTILAIENKLNNLGLSNADIFLSNSGSYSNGQNIVVTIEGGMGSGALAVANVIRTATTNTIDKIIITNPGSGYKVSPTVNVYGGQGPTLAAGKYNAAAVYIGEDKKRGGNSAARYSTRKVVLADGFNSGDLRVYLTAHKPSGSSIDVYYKILASGDAETWSDKQWQLMTQIEQPSYISTSYDDFMELVFAPGINNTANNSVFYVSEKSGDFYEFNTFAIKIVMSGTNTVDTPRIKDFRAIALPAA